MSAVLAWMLRNPVAMLLGVLLTFALAVAGIQSTRLGHAQRAYAEFRAEVSADAALAAQKLTAAVTEARRIERERADQIAAIDQQHQQELSHVHEQAARTESDLRNGNLRLRQSLAQACPGGTNAGADAGAGERDDPATAAVVSRASQERILRIGTEADDVSVRLRACQAIVLSDRKIGGKAE